MNFRKLQSTLGYHDKLSRQFPFSSYNITVADSENDEIVPQRLPMKTPDMTSYKPREFQRKPIFCLSI